LGLRHGLGPRPLGFGYGAGTGDRRLRRSLLRASRRPATRYPIRTRCSMFGSARPAARSKGPKAADLARFIGSNTCTALFFCACVGMSLKNNISARKNARREVGGPAQRLQAGDTGAHPTPTPDFFRAISAGEWPLSSKHCGRVWRQAQLTGAIRPSSAAVVENYYVAHLACCRMQ
jgi:hypothetical protein